MINTAIKLSLLYLTIVTIDPYLLSWQALNRPIVVAPLTGLILGDFSTGVIMGAALESIFMGISPIGGSVPADATTSSIIAVAYTVLTGANAETGLAIALPIGTVMASIAALFTPIFASLAPYWEKLAISGNNKKFIYMNLLVTVLMSLIKAVVLFIAIAYGVDGLNNLLSTLPAWFMRGLEAASGMMVAVGFAILTSMIWSSEVGGYFFLGYVLVKYLEMDVLPIAIIGAVIAIAIFIQDKKIIDLKNLLTENSRQNNTIADDEEDFF